ncbi:restriction endonuclease subunit S [Quisquiliibacterium transsilvanicum]|uniref:Type I restriction enzyme S subunit n=1 Tax=Quisquiliibacterium transsilvanicum TaxID=1549638 RepID=A0A7W8HJA3_9BURK|nr:type I restriction enzyme S subunit [Quisquiliibacterium transsilvanicum]
MYIDISSIDRDTKRIFAAKSMEAHQAPSRARQVLKTGDVLVSMTRPNLNAVAVVPTELDGAIASTGFHVLRSRWLRPQYLYRLVQTRDFIEAMTAAVQGALYPAVRPKDIDAYRLTFHTPNQQERIVDKLEELLSDLDAGVAELDAARKKLERYRQALLKAAVEGALTAEWRAGNPPSETGAQLLQRILTERRARWEAGQLAKFEQQGKAPPKNWKDKYVEPAKPDVSDLPMLPEQWVWTSLGECFQVLVGATPSRKETRYWGGPIPWVSSGEVRFTRIKGTRETITQAGLENSSTRINPAGSVLLGMIGEGKTRGQVAILDMPAANNQNCAAIWVSETPAPPEYVFSWLWSQYEQTRRGSSGNNQPALNKSIVERVVMPLPPLAEMQEIVRLVDHALDQIERQHSAIDHALRHSAAQRQNILRAAFAGELVPQDPDDEPASVLLARIRAQRAAQAEEKKPRRTKARKAADA